MSFNIAQSNVDPDDPTFQPMLKDLQANILRGHGRKFAHHLFLCLRPSKSEAARQWIAKFAAERITSALNLEVGRRLFKSTGRDGGAVFTLSISATGYAALGFTPKQLPQEMETPANSIVRDGPVFASGAKGSVGKLGDGDVQADWEKPFRENVDVLIIVADDQPDKAQQLADSLIQQVKEFSDVFNQKAHVLKRKVGEASCITIEHFGYADGVSQPLYFKDDIEAQPSTKQWDDREPLNLVLVPDPHGKHDHSFGSFLVFRKLEQDVAGFMQAEEHSIPAIKDSDGIVNRDLAGAMMVGRFRNGNPLITSGGFTGDVRCESQILNDFDYSSDPPSPPSDQPQYSSKCPFFSHIRITNPRADITVVPSDFVHSVRLTRRGIPYQDKSRFGSGREDDVVLTEDDLNRHKAEQGGVGLLFMSYQAHIGKQFEFIQNNWANHGHIAGQNIGPDGVIGQLSPLPQGLPFKPEQPDLQPRRVPEQWGRDMNAGGPVISFGGFIRNKGGEYFFTPSISFLQQLAER